MKNVALILLFALAACPAGTLLAQDITGTWQGTLHTNRDVREVIRISKDDNVIKAVLFSIDLAPGQSFAAPRASFQGTTLKLDFPAIGGAYNGTLNPDRNSITGTFLQGDMPLALNLQRATPQTAWTLPDPPPPPLRMAPDAKPGFEVATIKPSDPNRPGRLFTVRGQDLVTINTTLRNLITTAYGVHDKQIGLARNREIRSDREAGRSGPAQRRSGKADHSEADRRSVST